MTTFIATTPSYGHPSSPEEGTTLGVGSKSLHYSRPSLSPSPSPKREGSLWGSKCSALDFLKFWLTPKLLSFGKTQIHLVFRSLIRNFAEEIVLLWVWDTIFIGVGAGCAGLGIAADLASSRHWLISW